MQKVDPNLTRITWKAWSQQATKRKYHRWPKITPEWMHQTTTAFSNLPQSVATTVVSLKTKSQKSRALSRKRTSRCRTQLWLQPGFPSMTTKQETAQHSPELSQKTVTHHMQTDTTTSSIEKWYKLSTRELLQLLSSLSKRHFKKSPYWRACWCSK